METAISFTEARVILKLRYQFLSLGPPVQSCLCSNWCLCYLYFITISSCIIWKIKQCKMSNMCHELICSVINSGHSLNATFECVLWPVFLQKINCTIFHELQLLLCCSNFFEIWWGQSWRLCLQNTLQFPSVCFHYLFTKLFLFQSKTKNSGSEGNPDTLFLKS